MAESRGRVGVTSGSGTGSQKLVEKAVRVAPKVRFDGEGVGLLRK